MSDTSIPSTAANDSTGVSVHLHGAAKQFGERSVLKGVNITIQEGQFVAIVGRSGCGKSTLLRLLAGLDAPTSGTVQIGQAHHRAQDVRIMYQDARLLPWQKVVDNVALGLPGNRRERRRLALDALAQVGLADRALEWPSVLSGGQRQRVALARALVHRPRLLLLDEPLGALDALTRIEMQQLIESLWRDSGFTAILVTHDVAEAIALADRVLLIEQGAIALDLPVTLARPRQRGNADFASLEGRVLDRLLSDTSAIVRPPAGEQVLAAQEDATPLPTSLAVA